MEIESIGAIQDCMEDLGFHLSEAQMFDAQAKIVNLFNERKRGRIKVTFQSNWHSGDGPYIEMDEAIKGYGIQYSCFKPKWQRFKYEPSCRTLKVEGDGYSFTLEFNSGA